MTIDPRHLSNLLAVANYGSFNKAAAALGISQPALSNSISRLERRLGFKVLDRTRRGCAVNEYGRILLQSARTVEALIDQTAEALRLKRLGIAGPLRVGATPSMLLKFMPDVMASVLKNEEPVQISVVEGLDDQLLPALRSGDLDLVLGPTADSALPADLIEEVLFSDTFSIGVGPRNPLANRRIVSLRELTNSPWVLPGPGSAYRRYVEALFMAAKLPWPADSVVSDNLQLVESIVASTNRVTVVTQVQASTHNFWRLKTIPLRGAGRRSLSIKWRRAGELSELGQRIVRAAHQVAAVHQQLGRRAQV